MSPPSKARQTQSYDSGKNKNKQTRKKEKRKNEKNKTRKKKEKKKKRKKRKNKKRGWDISHKNAQVDSKNAAKFQRSFGVILTVQTNDFKAADKKKKDTKKRPEADNEAEPTDTSD